MPTFDQQNQVDRLVKQIALLIDQYQTAMRDNTLLSVRKDLRLKMRKLRDELEELRVQNDHSNLN